MVLLELKMKQIFKITLLNQVLHRVKIKMRYRPMNNITSKRKQHSYKYHNFTFLNYLTGAEMF